MKNKIQKAASQAASRVRQRNPKPVSFSPYNFAVEIGAVEFFGGINWTWVTFPDEETRQRFDVECRKNGYRVRDYGKCKTQYHRWQD